MVEFFQESTYRDKKGETRPCYLVTKKGCEFIAHKLTGIKGTAFTARYINRFHEMEEELKPKSPAEMLVFYANQLLENERWMNNIESKVDEINAKIITRNENYFTISGYASLRGMNVDTSKANMLGRKATKLSREYGYDIDKVTDSRFGKVKVSNPHFKWGFIIVPSGYYYWFRQRRDFAVPFLLVAF